MFNIFLILFIAGWARPTLFNSSALISKSFFILSNVLTFRSFSDDTPLKYFLWIGTWILFKKSTMDIVVSFPFVFIKGILLSDFHTCFFNAVSKLIFLSARVISLFKLSIKLDAFDFSITDFISEKVRFTPISETALCKGVLEFIYSGLLI